MRLEEEGEGGDLYVAYPKNYHSKTPAQRAESFRQWAESHKDGPGLSDWAVSRDSMYD